MTGVAELVFLCLAGGVAGLLSPWPRARLRVQRASATGAARFVAIERARLAGWFDHGVAGGNLKSRAGERLEHGGYRYLVLRAVVGVLGGYVAAGILFFGVLLLFGGLWALRSGQSDAVPLRFPGVHMVSDTWVVGIAGGIASLALFGPWCLVVVAAERRLAAHFLGADTREAMRRRITELTVTRTGMVRAIDDERRRIERDLHDGVQQRGLALSMLLGRARHTPDPGKAARLVDEAYTESRRLLDELRSVAWRIYPAALDELGLRDALRGVAERSGVPVSIDYRLAGRPVSEVETAVYFVVREAITNATKHAAAREIVVSLTEDERSVNVVISDDGRGGADPSGGGLSGLARRVRALDGRFDVHSPAGGPTRVTATLPLLLQETEPSARQAPVSEPPCG
ncbi:sensor histidine kinase [Sphaerisporangium flaviroseum]|uniref:sensor histidine kinase n=1 Tax=Sphaerisporangium flaviroseum TaxID=509199 RepID=UPI0031E997C9